METVRVGSRAALVPIAVDVVLLIGLLLASLGPARAASAARSDPPLGNHSAANTSGVVLSVDPPSYWLRTGSNVTLRAVWSALSPLCRLDPLWYFWSENVVNVTGYLNTTTGPSTIFTADSFSSGTTRVEVESQALLDCGENEQVVNRTSVTNLSASVPLVVRDVHVSPELLTPGQEATLEGTVAGGEPPYTLDVSWGNGTRSVVTASGPGTFSVDHRVAAGEFDPSVLASDSVGDFENASADEGISVGPGLEVAILTSAPITEVGVPVDFEGEVSGPFSGLVPLFDCSNATVGPETPDPGDPYGIDFSCTFNVTGNSVVVFGLYSTSPGGDWLSTVLEETVAAIPDIRVESVPPISEAGRVTFAQVELTGGVPPIALSWNLSGNRSNGAEEVGADGGGVLALTPVTAGTFEIGLRATDSIGSVATNDTATVQVEPPLAANATGLGTSSPPDVLALVDGAALTGCPPFVWWVLPTYLPGNESAENGTLATAGDFSWTGSYAREGSVSITVGVDDACGANWLKSIEIPLVPPLSALAGVSPGPSSSGETLAVNVSIYGGSPPFHVGVRGSDGESWNRTALTDGVARWLLTTNANGSLRVALTIEDLLGATAAFNLSVFVEPPTDPAPPPASPPPPSTVGDPVGNASNATALGAVWLLVPVALPVGGAAAVLLVRRRRSRRERTTSPPPDAEAVLRRIIEPADGAERFTVELLAEEAGVPVGRVRSTIDRLVGEGRIHSESGADGEEVLSWSPESGR
jgi:hypothetical protein